MDANQDILQGQWPEIKGQVRTQWGNLTDDDVRQLNGTTAGLVNALRQRYGYGMDHAAIGFQLAKQWSLPPELATVIRKHHDALCDCGPLVAAVAMADVLVKQAHIGYDGDCKTPSYFMELQAHLQLSAQEYESLAAFAAGKREGIERFFKLSC